MLLNNQANTFPSNIESSTQNSNTLSIGSLLHIFWLRRYLFLAVVVLIVLSGNIYIYQLTPRYTASTKVLIGVSKAQVVDVESVLNNEIRTDSELRSEIEVLNSNNLAEKVIRKLDLLKLPEFNPSIYQNQQVIEKGFLADLNPKQWLSDDIKEAIGLKEETNKESLTNEAEQQEKILEVATAIYLSKVKITPIKGSQVVIISAESLDPKLATTIANAHADGYIIGQLEAKFEATQKATSWLNEQLTGLRQKLADSEKAVELYRSGHGLTQGTSGTGLVGEQLSEINGQLIIARAQKAEASARLAQVNQLLRNGTDIETASEVLSSAMIQGLRGQEIELTRKLSEMSVEYGEKHPKLIRLNAELEDLRAKIKTEIGKIAAGLRNELGIASAREASLQNSLRTSENKSGMNRTEEIQLHALEREANANKMLFETFLNRFKETSSTQSMQEANAHVISTAKIPLGASFPNTRLMLNIVIAVAVLIAIVLIIILELLHLGLRTPEEIEETLGFPAIGLIPKTAKKINAIDYILEKPNSSLNEAISSLRISLMLSDPDNAVKTIVVTSSVPAEGKSMLALCLGRNAAIAGQKVVVIDADFRRPTIEKKLGLSNKAKGLTDLIMSQDTRLADFMYKDKKTNLLIMPKGGADYINPADIFASHRMAVLLQTLKQQFDLIIFDTPPVMAVADARVLASLVDKTIFVVAWDKTPRKTIKAGLEQIIKARASISGVVLQQVDLQQYGRYSYGESGYYYHYSKYSQYYTD
ncbi:MAG: polysaccharide biosynthesis tyrosine autokinase [Methylococcaceae bacterium]